MMKHTWRQCFLTHKFYLQGLHRTQEVNGLITYEYIRIKDELHEEANIDVKHSRHTEYDINE